MTINGSIVRQQSTPEGTPGALILENGFNCNTLELPWKNNQRGVSCTDVGTDHGRVWFSPTMNRLVIRYADRNGRFDCLIHTGNWAGEAPGDRTDVHGCTLVGYGYGMIERPDGVQQWGILRTREALKALLQSLLTPGADPALPESYEDVVIEYRWAEGCEPSQ